MSITEKYKNLTPKEAEIEADKAYEKVQGNLYNMEASRLIQKKMEKEYFEKLVKERSFFEKLKNFF
ncbi:hypothetical protein [Marinilactibacillus kalidii]|uniref:hypothetical protein n=1 Tax=Marinilactibacillus kalidii TaxID=2820274 RepID=UPI001ABE57E7|nr:hypothetical protein [Marinilactibacillus kalidii]